MVKYKVLSHGRVFSLCPFLPFYWVLNFERRLVCGLLWTEDPI